LRPASRARSGFSAKLPDLDALDNYSLVKKRPITLPLLKELLANSQTQSSS